MTTNESAPAVPVGVQPEPAEEAIERVLRLHRAVRVGERGVECNCGDWFRTPDLHDDHRQRVLRDLGLPAVPVVHPEPGDRERQWAVTLFGESGRDDDGYPSGAIVLRLMRQDQIARLMALADAEVAAAAVAAVRADTAQSIIEHRDRDGFIAVTNWSAGWHQGMTDAAALVASSPTTPESNDTPKNP